MQVPSIGAVYATISSCSRREFVIFCSFSLISWSKWLCYQRTWISMSCHVHLDASPTSFSSFSLMLEALDAIDLCSLILSAWKKKKKKEMIKGKKMVPPTPLSLNKRPRVLARTPTWFEMESRFIKLSHTLKFCFFIKCLDLDHV